MRRRRTGVAMARSRPHFKNGKMSAMSRRVARYVGFGSGRSRIVSLGLLGDRILRQRGPLQFRQAQSA